jgi:copper(I)-binding protein
MTIPARFALGSLLCLSAASVAAHDFKHGPITIAHPFVRVDTACDGPVTRAYVMLLVNQGSQPDRLVGAQLGDGHRGRILAAPKAESGVPQPVAGVDLPAGARSSLMPPALVIEFPLPSRDLQQGAAVPGVLQFERAGAARIRLMIEAAKSTGKGCAAAGGPSHGKHQHPRGHKH